MNKKKYIEKLDKKMFMRSSFFKKTNIVNEDKNISIEVDKVKNDADFIKYVVGLQSFTNHSFILYPRSFFSTQGFKSNVDVIFLDSNFCVVDIQHKLPPNKKISFEGNFYSVLILQPGLAR